MPLVWNEHAAGDLAVQLHLTAGAADGLLGLAHDLAVKLPLTSAALRDGILDLDKARTIALVLLPAHPGRGRAAEKILLGLAGVEEMTWGMIRDRIARAVIEVNPWSRPEAPRAGREGQAGRGGPRAVGQLPAGRAGTAAWPWSWPPVRT